MAITLFADGRIEKNGTNITGFTPAFSAYTSSSFDIATSTYVKLLCQTELFDTDGAYDASTSVFTVPSGKAGAYQINATVAVDDINDQTAKSLKLSSEESFYRSKLQKNLQEYLEVWSLIDKIWHLKPLKFEYMKMWKSNQEKEMYLQKGNALQDQKLSFSRN